MELYQFIANEFFSTEKELNISLSDHVICIKIGSRIYEEPFFEEPTSFTSDDIDKLLIVANNVNRIEDLKGLESMKFDFLRIYYLITHEKYFVDNPSLDKHGRISSLSLRKEFNTILKLPICDVLRHLAYRQMGMDWKQNRKLILTCDYDIMNIWDIYDVKDFFKLLLKKGIRFEIGKLVYYLYSFFFSRKYQSANGFLNTKMFDTKLNCERIAFLIAKSDNKEIDCNANYTDKPVVDFIQSLKEKKIELGLHTNYNTMQNPNSIHDQIAAFNYNITREKPSSNRHHYLRYQFPSYLDTFEGTTIKRDFSIYFAESLLFRCGISSPFKVWNSERGRPYETTLIPTTLMDGTFTDYLKLDYPNARIKSIQKCKMASDFGQSIVLLWHNSSTFKKSINYTYHSDLFKDIIIEMEKVDY
jgi:hypothetical protein